MSAPLSGVTHTAPPSAVVRCPHCPDTAPGGLWNRACSSAKQKQGPGGAFACGQTTSRNVAGRSGAEGETVNRISRYRGGNRRIWHQVLPSGCRAPSDAQQENLDTPDRRVIRGFDMEFTHSTLETSVLGKRSLVTDAPRTGTLIRLDTRPAPPRGSAPSAQR